MGPATPPWASRFSSAPGKDLLAFSSSVGEDALIVDWDVAGSIAHVAALHAASLVTRTDAATLIKGLQKVEQDLRSGKARLDDALEDVHMNVEHLVSERLGKTAAQLHTARSRNDQVALDVALFVRACAAHLAGRAIEAAQALLRRAREHADTPWLALTHGQAAQATTLGHLLVARALQFAQDVERFLAVAERVIESPLGAGAVAGSTLALRADVSAKLLALEPLVNSVHAVSDRDHLVDLAHASAVAGAHAASLANEWLWWAHPDLQYVQFPEEVCTGSSLMPHKRNPDVLELIRSRGNALAFVPGQILAIVAQGPQGYNRDLQEAKRILLEWVPRVDETLAWTATAVVGARFFEPGIPLATVATDIVEALVAHGVPFREAYTLVAQAARKVDDGFPWAEALPTDLAPAAAAAASKVIREGPQASRRIGPGGPASVDRQVQAVQQRLDQLVGRQADAEARATAPLRLLTKTPDEILGGVA